MSWKSSIIVHNNCSVLHSSWGWLVHFWWPWWRTGFLGLQKTFQHVIRRVPSFDAVLLGSNSAIPIWIWVAFSFSLPSVLLWKSSSVSFTLSRMGFRPLLASLPDQIDGMRQVLKMGPFCDMYSFRNVSRIVSYGVNHFIFQSFATLRSFSAKFSLCVPVAKVKTVQ